MARWLGIDLDGTTVRVALLRASYGRTVVEALREEQATSPETLGEAIRVASFGLRPESVAVAIDGANGFIRRLLLPAAAQRELDRIVGFELESTLPIEIDDAVVDHRVLRGTIDEGGRKQLRILAGAATTAHVAERIELVRSAVGLEPERVGVGALPLANLAQLSPELRKLEPVALVAVEADHTDLVLLSGGEPHVTRSLSLGTNVMPEGATGWARELRQTLAAWHIETGLVPTRVYLAGSGRAIAGMDPFVEAELELPVVNLPLPSLEGLPANDVDHAARFARAMGLALGLSRRAVDLSLRSGALESQPTYGFLREKTPLLAGLATALAVSFGFSVYAESQGLETEHEQLQSQLAQATRTVLGEETRDPERATELLDRAIAGKSDDPLPEIDAFGVMVELAKRTPTEVTHDVAEFDFNRGAVVIRGIVNSIDEAQLVSSKLGEHPCFRDLKISRTTKLESRQKYQLEFSVKCGGPKKSASPAASGSSTAAPKAPKTGATP